MGSEPGRPDAWLVAWEPHANPRARVTRADEVRKVALDDWVSRLAWATAAKANPQRFFRRIAFRVTQRLEWWLALELEGDELADALRQRVTKAAEIGGAVAPDVVEWLERELRRSTSLLGDVAVGYKHDAPGGRTARRQWNQVGNYLLTDIKTMHAYADWWTKELAKWEGKIISGEV